MFKILKLIFFSGFQKNEYFLGKKIYLDIFFRGGGSSQNCTIFRGHFYAFLGLFLRSRYRIGGILGGGVAKISNIFGRS